MLNKGFNVIHIIMHSCQSYSILVIGILPLCLKAKMSNDAYFC